VKPLLAELHAHTTWSDGALSLSALVDLYGTHGFDVLCVTDHTLPGGHGSLSHKIIHTEFVVLGALMQTPHHFRTKRQLWATADWL